MRGSATLRTFGVCLWKEWRDHRAVLLGMVLIVPLLLAILGLALPRRMFDHPTFPQNTAVACLAILVISLATDLVPGEARRGHRGFLERLPGGLRAPFLAKFVLFAASAFVFTVYGYAAGAEACYILVGAIPDPRSPGVATGILAVVALWTFTLSCSLPRGALSLPAVAALALVLAVPIFVVREIEPSWRPFPWWRWESVALWGVGGVAAAWAAFRSRSLVRAGRACVAIGVLCATPYWADAVHYTLTPEPSILHGYLGEGGRYVFVDRTRNGRGGAWGALAPVIVDLRDGTTSQVESEHRWFRPVFSWHMPQRYVGLGFDVFDGRTGERVEVAEEDRRQARRVATPWRTPDGRRVWRMGNRLEADGPDGTTEILGEFPLLGSRCGFGFEVPNGFFDLSRKRLFGRRDLAIRSYGIIRVRAGPWLVRCGRDVPYELFDPDANALEPARGLEAGDSVGPMADDGRFFVTRGDSLLLVDPGSGATVAIQAPPGVTVWGEEVRTPAGKCVVWCAKSWSNDRRLARFDHATGALVATAFVVPDDMRVIGCLSEDEVLVHDDRAIYRLRFGSNEKKEIWRVR